MTIKINANSLKNLLNQASPHVLADIFRSIALGDTIRTYKTTLRNKVPAADSGSLSSLNALVLPDDAKASTILRAYARTGTAGLGEMTVEAYGTTPTSGQIAVAPNGDIVTLGSDAITNLDVAYEPEKGDIFEIDSFTVASNVLTFPTAFKNLGIVLLLEAVATVGTTTGKKVILVPASSPSPSAGQACLNQAKTTVTFATADAVTQANVKFMCASAIDVDALLTALAAFS